MNKPLFYTLSFINKGWMVSLLALLPFLQKDFNITLVDIGLLSMTLTVFSVIFSLFAGTINKHVGNRNIIIISLLAYLSAWFLLAITKSPMLLWVVYALGGISSGLFDPITTAIIAKNALSNKVGREIGDFIAFGDLGRVVLTAITTLLVGYILITSTSFLYMAAAIVLLTLFLVFNKAHEVHIEEEEKLFDSHILSLVKHKKYALSLITGFTDSFSSTSLFIFLPFLLLPKGINLETTGVFTALFFFGYFAGRMLLGRLADTFGTTKVLVVTQCTMFFLILSLIYIENTWLLVLNLFLLGMCTRGTSPIIKSMVASSLERPQFEKGYGLYSAVVRTANAISRPLFGFIAAYFGINNVFLFASVVTLITIVPAIKFYQAR